MTTVSIISLTFCNMRPLLCYSLESESNSGHEKELFAPTMDQMANNGSSDTLFSWAPKSLQIVPTAMKLKDACSLEEKL